MNGKTTRGDNNMAIRFRKSSALKAKLDKVLKTIPEKSKVHLSVLDLTSGKPEYAGFQDKQFIYPASIYKLYVAMGVLYEVEKERLNLQSKVRVTKHNVVSDPKEQVADSRPMLASGM